MTDTQAIGRLLLLVGLVLALAGGLLLITGRIPFIGRLPGDFAFNWGGVRVYLPLATSLLLSVLLTLLFMLWGAARR